LLNPRLECVDCVDGDNPAALIGYYATEAQANAA
jgi:hypothetical protein